MLGHAARRGMAGAIARARAFSDRWGAWGIFYSRWLVAPLGPAISLLSGVVGVPWARFALFCLLGEIVWVALYLSLGFAFSRSVVAITRIAGDLGMALAAGLVALLLALRLRALRRDERAGRVPPADALS